MTGKYFLVRSPLKKKDGALQPDWRNTALAGMARLGSIGAVGDFSQERQT